MTRAPDPSAMVAGMPYEFVEGTICGFFGCTALSILTSQMAPILFEQSWDRLDEGNRVLFCTTVVSMALAAVFWVLCCGAVETADFWAEWKRGILQVTGLDGQGKAFTFPAGHVYMPASAGFHLALGIDLGYFFFDTMMMIIKRKELLAALKPAFYLQMCVHHVFSIVLWPMFAFNNFAVWPIWYFLHTELSGVWLNLRWLLDKLDMADSKLYFINGATLFVAYIIIRVIPAFYLIAFWFHGASQGFFQHYDDASKSASSTIRVLGGIFAIVPILLNLFWFSLLYKGVRSALAASGGKKKL